MSEAATQKGVAEMSDAEMLDSLTAMFDAQMPSDEPDEEQEAEEVEPTAETTEEVEDAGDGDTLEETEAEQDTEESEAEDEPEDEAEEASDDEKWTPKSLDELAEALEMKPEDVATALKVKVKVDGQEGEATLKDIIKSYQLEKTLNGRLEAHANERKAFEAESSKMVTTLQERLQDAELTVSAMEQMLLSDFQGVDWADLKENDPTEYVLKQQELRDRYGSIQQVKNKLSEDQQKHFKEQEQELQQQQQAYLTQQKEALLAKMPEWRDSERMTSDMKQLVQYMRSEYGATDQEFATIGDHRLFVAFYKAMLYDNLHTKADPKMKKLKTKPKFVKPGARRDPAQVSEKRKSEAMSRAKKLQTDDAWAEALLAKIS